jgi:carboxypeptidase C (cathepsin A)
MYVCMYVCVRVFVLFFSTAGIIVNFAGISIGDGWVDPLIQFQAYIEFSARNKLISNTLQSALEDEYLLCKALLEAKDYVTAAPSCLGIVGAILADNPGMSFYDIRLKCPSAISHDCYGKPERERER